MLARETEPVGNSALQYSTSMNTYLIRDGNEYLMWFSNNCAWFTQIRCEALTFDLLEEAKFVARALGSLASHGLRVQEESEAPLPGET